MTLRIIFQIYNSKSLLIEGIIELSKCFENVHIGYAPHSVSYVEDCNDIFHEIAIPNVGVTFLWELLNKSTNVFHHLCK